MGMDPVETHIGSVGANMGDYRDQYWGCRVQCGLVDDYYWACIIIMIMTMFFTNS